MKDKEKKKKGLISDEIKEQLNSFNHGNESFNL